MLTAFTVDGLKQPYKEQGVETLTADGMRDDITDLSMQARKTACCQPRKGVPLLGLSTPRLHREIIMTLKEVKGRFERDEACRRRYYLEDSAAMLLVSIAWYNAGVAARGSPMKLDASELVDLRKRARKSPMQYVRWLPQ